MESGIPSQSFFSWFFQCSLIHHTMFLPADISQKSFFMLDSALSLWPESVQRCSSAVQQCCQHSISPWSFVVPYTDSTFLSEKLRRELYWYCCLKWFFFYSPNRIPAKFHSLSKKGRKMYFLDCRVKSSAKICNFRLQGRDALSDKPVAAT